MDNPKPDAAEPQKRWVEQTDMTGMTYYIPSSLGLTQNKRKLRVKSSKTYFRKDGKHDGTVKKRLWFLNHNTKTTTWTDPRLIDPEVRDVPLPDGWEVSVDADKKKVYFVNHNTGSTTWEDPRPKTNLSS